ncbi:TetR/AcrR family transcriptional regulator [Papillibacter cinnamivorans]|nr:TetR-like C-terminal domain-containing protein [Papillibacter cinnamivorans]
MAKRTQNAIAGAFLSLIRENTYEEISVTDLCRKADVVRKTFYNNFHSKDDVVHYLIDDIFHEMESGMDLRNMSVREILLNAFRFVTENREALLLFYSRGLIRFAYKSMSAYITEDHILTKLDRNAVDARAYKYIAAQISAVLISIIETWIENGFEESVEFLAELTEALMYKPMDIPAQSHRPV